MRYRLTDRLIPLKEQEEFGDAEIRVELLSQEDMRNSAEQFSHKKVLVHLLERLQYCRVETFGGCLLGTLVVLEVKNLSLKRIAFGFYLTKNRIIFVDDSGFVKTVLGRLKELRYEDNPSIAVFLTDFLNRLIEDDSIYLQDYENGLIELEAQMLEKGQNDRNRQNSFGQRIIRYRKDMLRLHSYFSQMEDFGNILEANVSHVFSSEELNLFAAFSHHVGCLSSHTQMLREYAVQIYDMYQSQLDLMQTHNMNLLTVVTTIFLPLSLLVGWYGMNFTNMPELFWEYGYMWAIGLSMGILMIEIYIFRKKHLL